MEQKEKLTVTAVLATVAALISADVTADLLAGSSFRHVAVESVVILAALTGIVVLWSRALASFRRRIRLSEQKLELSRQDAERWRREAAQYVNGLSQAIDAQLERWELTASEKEVALLLLKGLSQKEIAKVRQVSEKTIHHQSLAIYRKSGLKGRADLAAFFLEDLLSPGSLPPMAAGGS